jgi:hypothetical protein
MGRATDTSHYHRERAYVISISDHCWICRRPLTGLPFPHPLSSTADHSPISVRDGLLLGWSLEEINDRSNLKAAHLKCNQDAGANGRGTDIRPASNW